MKTITTTLGALALMLTFGGVAAAQDRPAPRPTAADPETTYDFEDDRVGGTYRLPEGDRLSVRSRAGHTSLVRPRAHFINELTGSVERI